MSKDLKIKSRQILIDNNIPVTKPRLLLIEILLKNRGPIKIEEIIKISKGKLAVSSLYRIVNNLKNFDVINEFKTPDNTKVIELSSLEDDHHHHIFCESCGAVYDFDINNQIELDLEKEILKVEEKYNVKVNSHSLEFLGYCNKC
ncbi:MAG: Fur family transcriptional regulator [Dehalococcoidia bacterium]|tara:strand:+ start:1860 stop:2294 length:435 start_codon:yes stop_codon:yes gene_type:complete